MSEIVKGFDSRYWNGILPEGTDFELVGIKISQNYNFIPSETLVQWQRALNEYGLLRLPFHYWEAPPSWEDAKINGQRQAQYMWDAMLGRYEGDLGELPPCLDMEDTADCSVHRRRQSIKHFLLTIEDLWGKRPMVYTAHWWFDRYFTNSAYPFRPEDYGGWNIYDYDLWNADPPPTTAVGEWQMPAPVTQIVLETSYPGFNAGIDIDETTQEWIDRVTNVVVPPIPDTEPIDPPIVCSDLDARILALEEQPVYTQEINDLYNKHDEQGEAIQSVVGKVSKNKTDITTATDIANTNFNTIGETRIELGELEDKIDGMILKLEQLERAQGNLATSMGNLEKNVKQLGIDIELYMEDNGTEIKRLDDKDSAQDGMIRVLNIKLNIINFIKKLFGGGDEDVA